MPLGDAGQQISDGSKEREAAQVVARSNDLRDAAKREDDHAHAAPAASQEAVARVSENAVTETARPVAAVLAEHNLGGQGSARVDDMQKLTLTATQQLNIEARKRTSAAEKAGTAAANRQLTPEEQKLVKGVVDAAKAQGIGGEPQKSRGERAPKDTPAQLAAAQLAKEARSGGISVGS